MFLWKNKYVRIVTYAYILILIQTLKHVTIIFVFVRFFWKDSIRSIHS